MTLILMAGSWVTGVYLATLVSFPWPSVLLFLVASALLALLLRGRGLTLLPALALALLSLGALRGSWPPETGYPLPIQAYNGAERITVEGVVSSDPQPLGGSGWRFPLSVERVRAEEEWRESRGILQVVARPSPSLVAAREEPLFRYGDRLVLTGKAEAPPVLQEFDYREYLARQGIFSTMVYPEVELVGEGEGNWLLEGVYSVRYRLSRALSQAIAEPQNSLAQALLLGRQSTMPPELTQAFRDTGTSHLLAISGLQVGVLLGLSIAFSRWLLGARRQLYLLIPLLSVWAYAGISGMSPSVERAAIMGSIYLVGLYLGRQNSIMPALAVAAALMVGIQPRVLSSVSFQLSFTAMAGLALLAPPMERWLRRVFSGEEEESRWSQPLAYGIAATVAATIATLPLVAFYFQQLSLVGLPATLLALPANVPILGTGLLTSLLGLVNQGAAEVTGWAAWLSLSYLKVVIELFDAVPGNTLRVGWMGTPLVAFYYGALLAFVVGRSRVERLGAARGRLQRPAGSAWRALNRAGLWLPQGRVFWMTAALALLSAATVWTAALTRPDGRLHVTFLDVGQGDAALIVTPGGRQVLIDGGPDSRRLLTLLGERIPFWDHAGVRLPLTRL
ncbi:MAG: Lactamase protein [Dehalococcoidia bacterium]|nr:Lactamase protein [Dehalococcoidia bacterium]